MKSKYKILSQMARHTAQSQLKKELRTKQTITAPCIDTNLSILFLMKTNEFRNSAGR